MIQGLEITYFLGHNTFARESHGGPVVLVMVLIYVAIIAVGIYFTVSTYKKDEAPSGSDKLEVLTDRVTRGLLLIAIAIITFFFIFLGNDFCRKYFDMSAGQFLSWVIFPIFFLIRGFTLDLKKNFKLATFFIIIGATPLLVWGCSALT